jgi:hypothetical protein
MFKRSLILISTLVLCLQQTAFGLALDWSGHYRFEYVEIDKTEMISGSRKGYLLNNLVLMPHILPSDGFEVVSKIHLTENSDARYTNSQMGMIWGNSANSGTSTYTDNSNALSQTRPKTTLGVSQLYLKVDQEWGSVVIGRAPVQFGLGITHNAGNDPFSHWYDTRDTLAYKMHIGNLFIMPSISKQYADDFKAGNEITNQTLHFEYKNHDSGDWLGLFYETSRGNVNANDIPIGQPSIAGVTTSGSLNLNSYNIILGKDFTDFNFRVEGGFQSGSTGTKNPSGKDVRLDSYAVVTEFNIHPSDSKNTWNIKAGSVSGDNPETENFEGYFLDRNYDVALLLFNHSLGQNSNIFKTNLGHDPGVSSTKYSLDDEYISNALFVAPQWTRQLADRWKMRNTFAVANLNNSRMLVGSSVEEIKSYVGFEWDLGFTYKANDNLAWKFDSGLFIPGAAFKKGSADLKTSTVFGLSTSAAITF